MKFKTKDKIKLDNDISCDSYTIKKGNIVTIIDRDIIFKTYDIIDNFGHWILDCDEKKIKNSELIK